VRCKSKLANALVRKAGQPSEIRAGLRGGQRAALTCLGARVFPKTAHLQGFGKGEDGSEGQNPKHSQSEKPQPQAFVAHKNRPLWVNPDAPQTTPFGR
jgi:hypothetical protein